MKWEYHFVHTHSDMEDEVKLAKINKLATEGWRLVPSDFPCFSGVLMEREIPEQPAIIPTRIEDRTDWDAMRDEKVALDKRLQQRPGARRPFNRDIPGILRALIEDDLSFSEAADEFRKLLVKPADH